MIEALALAVRACNGIREQKVSLCTDDILFFVQDPVNSVRAIGKTLELFGRASGYKINVGKSVIVGLGVTLEMIRHVGMLMGDVLGTMCKISRLLDSLDEDLLIDLNLKPIINRKRSRTEQ